MMPGAKVVGSEQGKVTFELNGQQYRASMGPERTPAFEVARGGAFQPTKALDAAQAAARREDLVLDAAAQPGSVFAYESLGYENVSRQAGVQSFTHPNGSTIKFPRWGGNETQNWAAGEREKLTSALRDGRSYTHPDVAQAAAAGREAGIRYLRENLGQSTSTHDETFSALGYERVRQAGVVAFTNPQTGATISVPASGGAFFKWPAGEQDKLVKALRDGGSYAHPDVARAAAAGREAAIGDLGKNLGSANGYNAETFEALGYQRAIGARGNVTFTNSSNGSTVTLPPQQGRELAWAAGEQAQLMKALREGGQYTHPAARS